MSEQWQPAIIHNAHALTILGDKELEKRSVLIRPVAKPSFMRRDCNADNFFEMHPDHGLDENGVPFILCEHEILTD